MTKKNRKITKTYNLKKQNNFFKVTKPIVYKITLVNG